MWLKTIRMKKLIFRFWGINFLMSIVLFVLYRVVISKTDQTTDDNWFDTILFILELLLNLGFSVAYLVGMLVCSLTILLNLVTTIRNNFYLSLLTFLGIPLFCVIYLLFNFFMIFNISKENLLTTFLFFSLIYLIVTAVQFLIFRKRISTTLPDSKNHLNKL